MGPLASRRSEVAHQMGAQVVGTNGTMEFFVTLKLYIHIYIYIHSKQLQIEQLNEPGNSRGKSSTAYDCGRCFSSFLELSTLSKDKQKCSHQQQQGPNKVPFTLNEYPALYQQTWWPTRQPSVQWSRKLDCFGQAGDWAQWILMMKSFWSVKKSAPERFHGGLHKGAIPNTRWFI